MQKALFLDRDGVINVEKDYLYKIEDFEFIDGIFELCKYFIQNNYLIFIVTNQSGIARGYYSVDDFNKLTDWMLNQFLSNDIQIKQVYYCPHHPDITGGCECRKPKPGMIKEASKKYDIDLKNSIIIGDKESDIESGLSAGIVETYLFDKKGIVEKSKATNIVNNLKDIWN
jgi:D-glycero-D-manno-heptose 1,7-bisphosphate phosphatase